MVGITFFHFICYLVAIVYFSLVFIFNKVNPLDIYSKQLIGGRRVTCNRIISPRGKEYNSISGIEEKRKAMHSGITLDCCAEVGVIGGVSSESKLAAFGNRCSCTDAKLNTPSLIFFNFIIPLQNSYNEVTNKYRLSVTRVPVNFLHRLNADSSRSGSSFKNFSSRTTFSISELKRPFMPSWRLGNLTFKSATVLLKKNKNI